MVVLGLAAAWSACSTLPPATPVNAPNASLVAPSPTQAATQSPEDHGTACMAMRIPEEWRRSAETNDLPAGIRFGLTAVAADGTVFGQYNGSQGSGVGSVSRPGALMTITRYDAKVSGLNTLAVDAPWIVWSQGDSDTNMADWSVRAWNQTTGVVTTLATSHLADGTLVFGQQPLPVLRGAIAAWAQPLPRPGAVNESEVRSIDLSSGRVRVIATGRVSNPVFAGNMLVWARRDDAGRYSFEAVDASTMQPLPVPGGLSDPGSIVYLAGSPNYLAWSAEGLLRLTVWTVGTGQRRQYTAPDIKHYFQFLQLARHYVLWYGGISSSILDLDTNTGFDVAGTTAGSEHWIALEEPTHPVTKGEVSTSRVSRLALNVPLPALDRYGSDRECPH